MNTVCLCTALPAESRPLIEHFKLSLLGFRGIRCYAGDSVCLIETGIGKLKAAAAVAAMLHRDKHIDALINVGIVGGSADIGTRYIANSVIDKATEKQWFPHLPAARMLPGIKTIAIHTLDQPSREYQQDAAFDMEASGVLTAASAYLDTTRIQCIKSISDNASSDMADIRKEAVTELIRQCIEPVSALVDHFHTSPSSSDAANLEIEQLIELLSTRIRISVSDKHSIKRLLQRYGSLNNQLPNSTDLGALQSARDIKADLESRISGIDIRY